MRFVDEYRDPAAARALLTAIRRTVSQPWILMEVCGGQTHTLLRAGIDRLLPDHLSLVHGPGCPVCVTPLEMIDHAIHLAHRTDVILASFGDMLRVPGSAADLLSARAAGGDVRVVYSPLDAVRLAALHPDRQVIFFAVGFETTAPTTAMAVWQAHQLGLTNFFLLCAHVRVPPVMQAILAAPENRVQAFLAPGHVCTVMGTREYEALAEAHRVPIVVTGFEPLDLLQGIRVAAEMLEQGRHGVANQYARAVPREGNPAARRLMERVFEVCDRPWRGIGLIPEGGYRIQPEFEAHDAGQRFAGPDGLVVESALCIAGEILRGQSKPPQCAAFGTQCRPDHPLGAPMVSAEGACAAYFAYGTMP
jgi:hydrogenase expression/formation protein HypD